jgi:gluconate 2-dehydrogenase subunit 3-like protein
MSDRHVIPLQPLDSDPSATNLSATDDGLSRRAALQMLVSAAGAGVMLPSNAEAQHPMHLHLASQSTIAQAQQKAAAGAYTPEFLDAHQLNTLDALAEAIVPGSTTARVAPFLDQLLAVEAAATQRTFLGALGAFDMAAIAKHGKAWTAIAAGEQDAVLREASTADAKTSALRAQFENLKTWIAGAYYSSEPGMRELGWDGNVFHAELPGCTHPDGHKG